MNDASEVARLRAENDRLTQPWQSVCIFVSKPAKRTVAKAASWVLHCAPSVSLPRPECQQNQTSIAGFAFSRQTQSLTWLNRNDACKGLPLACRSNQSTHFAMASLVATDRSPDGQCCVHQLIGQCTRRQARQIGTVFGHIELPTLIEAERCLAAFLGTVKKRCLVFVGNLLPKGGRSTGKRLTPPITARLAPQRPDLCSPAKRARLALTANT